MPILNPIELEILKERYRIEIHNTSLSVRKPDGSEVVSDKDPLYMSETKYEMVEYSGFECSVYFILSGKINRLFEERNLQILKDIGLLNKDIWIVVYVPDYDLVTGVSKNLNIGDQIELTTGDWFYVQYVVKDSEGLQHKALVTK